MIKELKYFFYIFTIVVFIIFIANYYFSDENKRNSYRSIKLFEKRIIEYSNKLPTLESNTDKIIDYYSRANLIITRSGASVLGELINFKIPFIAIPLPTAADNHQYKNAEFYLKKGYGYLLEEKDIKNKLFDLIESIFNDKSLIKNILSNQNKYSDKDIFGNLTNQLEKF